MFASPRITQRDIATLDAEAPRWSALEDRLQAFCSDIVKQDIDERDEAGATRAYVAALAKAGLLGLVVPRAHGGEADPVSSTAICIARQHLSRVSGALDTAFIMQGLGSYPLVLAGSPGLQAAVLPKVARGEHICAFALTEPEAGSDISRMETKAHEDGDTITLVGNKCFISNAGVATSYVVFAREANDGPDNKPRFSAFWLAGDTPGLRIEPTRVMAPHPIGRVFLEDVKIPASQRVGAAGQGLKIALSNLDVFRPTVGAAAIGLADRAFEEAVAHLSTRVQFGKPLAKQQGLRFWLADLATQHLASQLLIYRAAAARDRGDATPDQPAMGKLMATETAQKVIDAAVQCLGGLGVSVGQRVEALYREVRALRIYEGTSEIQKLVIARGLFPR